MRVAKNSVKGKLDLARLHFYHYLIIFNRLFEGYSDVQTKVRDATSNDPWGKRLFVPYQSVRRLTNSDNIK